MVKKMQLATEKFSILGDSKKLFWGTALKYS